MMGRLREVVRLMVGDQVGLRIPQLLLRRSRRGAPCKASILKSALSSSDIHVRPWLA